MITQAELSLVKSLGELHASLVDKFHARAEQAEPVEDGPLGLPAKRTDAA